MVSILRVELLVRVQFSIKRKKQLMELINSFLGLKSLKLVLVVKI